MNDTFGKRLNYALKYRNKKAADVAKGTGLSQSIISQYLKDKFEAKNDKALLIANYLNINVMWLMGIDDNMFNSSSLKKDDSIEIKTNNTNPADFVQKLGRIMRNVDSDQYKIIEILTTLPDEKTKTLRIMAEALKN